VGTPDSSIIIACTESLPEEEAFEDSLGSGRLVLREEEVVNPPSLSIPCRGPYTP